MLTVRHHVKMHHIQGLLEPYFKIKKNSGEQEKESIIRVRVILGTEISIPPL